MPPTERMFVRMGQNDRALLAFLRTRWGIGDDSETLRVAIRRAAERERRAEPPDGVAAGGAGATPAGERRAGEARRSEVLPADALGLDLTALARSGKLDPVVGREPELERLLEVLSRLVRPNAVLLGAPGVGKTAIVEGLAQRLARDEVPDALRGKALLRLDGEALVWLGRFGDPGEVRAHLERLVTDAKHRGAILFIDHAPRLVEAADVAAPALLRLALLRGEVPFVAEATPEAYRRWLEPDALRARFQVLPVSPAGVEETVGVLRVLKGDLERHHDVALDDEALRHAATLLAGSGQPHILPGAAVDLLDEAASRLHLRPPAGGVPTGERPSLTRETIAGVLASWSAAPRQHPLTAPVS